MRHDAGHLAAQKLGRLTRTNGEEYVNNNNNDSHYDNDTSYDYANNLNNDHNIDNDTPNNLELTMLSSQ